MPSSTRRDFLATTGTLAAGLWVAPAALIAAPTGEAKIKILSTKIISQQPEIYHGWPTLTRRANGELILVWSGGRELHVCPFGRVDLMRSHDNGETWSYPQTVIDGPIDDRDAGVLETAKGTLLVTTFTSLAYAPGLAQAGAAAKAGKPTWEDAKLKRWLAAHNRISEEQRNQQLGNWMIRSTDGGLEWSARYRVPLNSPHGPLQLSDGRILYAGKALWTEEGRIGVAESKDDGQSWSWLATIPTRKGDDLSQYHELHAVETSGGRLIAQIRNHNAHSNYETLQSVSEDGGKTWSEPESTGVWGYPSHLLRLRDGRILMSHGHRRGPIGNQARLSEDDGRTWSKPIVISSDATSSDLGYPSTVELDDGSFVTVWYERRPDNPLAQLRQAHWKLA
ncbi:MAG: sialidase family protein [Planctomycetota bacterium]|nr:sialidase family protein [Planctomycetota bacterium]MDA1250943.1 sialidase family protein [Planctomycetota bacterium]